MKKLSLLLFALMPVAASAQFNKDDVKKYDHLNQASVRHEISIPGFDGYQTLKCDFHIHTVFSDGLVWPDIRVQEAWQEGLDAIAITDHIEYRPHNEIVKADHNESYNIAAAAAQNYDLIVIKGAEITRSKPLGHLNALFISDANKLEMEDPMDAIDEACRQGAYMIWNHPGWPDNKSTIYPVHKELIEAGKIHAYELYNYMESYPLTFDWYSKYGIAPMANTDIHGLVATDYAYEPDWKRPMTLVFAKERSQEGIREALDARRTVAFFHGTLVGDGEYLTKLLDASLKVEILGGGKAKVTNVSDISYKMSKGNITYEFPAATVTIINLPDGKLKVENCLIGHETYLEYTFDR